MQECCEALFDLFGFGLRSGEPEEGVVGLCRSPDYDDHGKDVLVCLVFDLVWSA
jgi:hypothetical protein